MKPIVATSLVFLPAALLPLLSAHITSLLLYERTALFHGQLWRLWTAHWVHFSPSHLVWNLLVVCAAGFWLESLRPGRLLRFSLFAAPVISLGLLGFSPDMHTYGGLSGLAVGLVVTLALTHLFHTEENRLLWSLLLVALAGKLALELHSNTGLFVRFTPDIRTNPIAHVAGAAAGVIYSLFTAAWALRPNPKPTRNKPQASALSWSPNATTRSS